MPPDEGDKSGFHHQDAAQVDAKDRRWVTIILRKVLKPKLIAVFVGVVALGMMIVGFWFNTIL